jgi:Putative stress-induced transcription regulator
VRIGQQQSVYQFDLSGGALCLDFANTVSHRHLPQRRAEHLDSYADLLAFATMPEREAPSANPSSCAKASIALSPPSPRGSMPLPQTSSRSTTLRWWRCGTANWREGTTNIAGSGNPTEATCWIAYCGRSRSRLPSFLPRKIAPPFANAEPPIASGSSSTRAATAAAAGAT